MAVPKKGDLAGSVAKVDMEELNKTPVASFDQALGGRVAGVQVVSGDGRPGAAANIVIRGSNTVSDNSDGSPLYVIDGFATDDPNAAAYNPSDIESMDILKRCLRNSHLRCTRCQRRNYHHYQTWIKKVLRA